MLFWKNSEKEKYSTTDLIVILLNVHYLYLKYTLYRFFARITNFLLKRGVTEGIWLIDSILIYILLKIIHDDFSAISITLPGLLTLQSMGYMVIIYATGLFINQGMKARTRIVIDEFTDFSKILNCSSNGIQSLLANELQRIKNLYSEDYEDTIIKRTKQEKDQTFFPIQVDQVSDLLKEASSSDATLTMGPLSVPIGIIFKILGSIFMGPRISGGLHLYDEQIILTARMTGRYSRSWRVQRIIESNKKSQNSEIDINAKIPAGEITDKKGNIGRSDTPAFQIDQMVKELGCRIFTELSDGGSNNWRAMYDFNEGLEYYRKSGHLSIEYLLNLKNAEQFFLKAIGEDPKFELAKINLSIIYQEQGKKDAAEKTLLQVIQMNPYQKEAYFAYVMNYLSQIGVYFENKSQFRQYYNKNDFNAEILGRLIDFSKQGISSSTPNDRYYNLLGIFYDLKGEKDESLTNYFLAINHSLKKLYIYLRDDHNYASRKYRDCQNQCLKPLSNIAQAIIFYCSDNTGLSRITIDRIFWLGLKIYPNSAELHYNLGKNYFFMKSYSKSVMHSVLASQIDPKETRYRILSCLVSITYYTDDFNFQRFMGELWNNPSEYVNVIKNTRDLNLIFTHVIQNLRETNQKRESDLKRQIERICELYDFISITMDSEKLNDNNLRDGINKVNKQFRENDFQNDRECFIAAYKKFLYYQRIQGSGACYVNYPEWLDYLEKKGNTYEKGVLLYRLAECYKKEYDDLKSKHKTEEAEEKYRMAIHNYTETIKIFEKYHKSDSLIDTITRSMIKLQFSNNKNNDAFPSIIKLYNKDPIDHEIVKFRALNYSISGDYRNSISEYERALLIEPDDKNSFIQIGFNYYTLSEKSRDKDLREKYFESAKSHIERIIALLEEESEQDSKILLLYALAFFYFFSNELDQGIYYCEIAESLSEQDLKLMISLNKAVMYYMNDYYEKFLNAISVLINRYKEESKGKTIDKKNEILLRTVTWFSEEKIMGYAYTKSYLLKAYSFLDRDEYSLSDIIEDKLSESSECLERSKEMYDICKENLNPIDRNEISALISSVEGLIRYKIGKFNNNIDDLLQAERSLNQAINLNPMPEYYIHEAGILSELSKTDLSKGEYYKELALLKCDQAIAMTNRKKFIDRANEIKNRVNKPAVSLPSGEKPAKPADNKL